MTSQPEPSLFFAKLDQKRREMGLDQGAFARELGISGGFWSLLRREKKPLSMDFAQDVIDRWPEFSGYLAADLASRSQRARPRRETAAVA